jgi:hypothetical protein
LCERLTHPSASINPYTNSVTLSSTRSDGWMP